MRLLLAGLFLAALIAATVAEAAEPPVRAFQQNAVASAPAFADGFVAYAYQKHKDTIVGAYEKAVRALSAEPAYLWTYPEKYVGSFYRSVYVPGDACRIRTLASHSQGLGGHYLLIVRPSPNPFTDCTKSPARGAFTRARPSTADGSDHSRYLFDVVAVTASLRDGAIDDTVSPNLTTACDLICRGDGNCIQGPHMARFGNGEIRVSHGLTSRTTYVGSKTATSQFCSAIMDLQAALNTSHVKYESSLKLDRATRGACPEAGFSNYPWFGKGEAARYATRQQVRIPDAACLESARMDKSFPYQGMTRAELTLTLRYPVGSWASCFTDTPLRTPAECKEHAVPVGGSRSVRAVILF